MDKIRVFRILCYEGDRDWVERTVADSIHGTKITDHGTIKAATIGDFPEVVVRSNTAEMADAPFEGR